MMQIRAHSLRLLVGVAALCVGLLWPTLILAHGPAQTTDQPLVTQKIHYQTHEAGEVALLWGVNGWTLLPEALRPAGTVVQKNAMSTPMLPVDDGFVISVQVPRDATIDYLFHITRAPSGVAVDAWEGNGAPNQDYHTVAQDTGVVDVQSTTSLVEQTFSGPGDSMLQWYGVLILLAVGLLFGLGLALRSRDPYLT
jgi:hypothetical protein